MAFLTSKIATLPQVDGYTITMYNNGKTKEKEYVQMFSKSKFGSRSD
jgi:hypothetical protein|tara:strand:- start:7 stop:147 length:141 start_codon:yes stop_codon:yes gene_type:complete